MVASDAVPVAGSKLNAPELRDLVVDVTRTISLILRPVGVVFPQATEEEATAIAAPAARMMARAPMVQRIIRRIADPVVLTGAVVALLSRGSRSAAPSPSAPRHAAQNVARGSAAAPSSASTATGTGSTPAAPDGALISPTDFAAAQQLRESILNGIAHADLR